MKFEQGRAASFADLMRPLRAAMSRYWRLSFAPSLTVAVLLLLLSVKLPSYYTSDVLISVQPQKFTGKLIEAPAREERVERLQSLIFEMISRQRRLNIIDKFKLYPEYKGVKGRERALKKMGEAIIITPESSTSGQRLSQTFRLQFSHEDSKTAYEVTKAISNLFIDESIISTKGESEGTVEFLDAQLRLARQKLEATEQQVQGFVKSNFGKLPEHLQAAVARLESAQAQLATNSQLLAAKTQKLEFLQKELRLDSRTVSVPAGGNGAESASTVSQLESALGALRSRYSEEHPDVIATKARLEALRAKGGKLVSVTRVSSEGRATRRDIADLESEMTLLNKENDHLKDTIAQLENDIKEMPIKQQELIKINRDYATVKANYERLSEAREDAALQKDLIASQRGTQFRILDPATQPVLPAGPQRMLIAVAGLIAFAVIFIGAPLVLYFLNSAFKTKEEIREELGVEVLGVIPPIRTPRALALNHRALSQSFLASVASFAVGLVVILFFV